MNYSTPDSDKQFNSNGLVPELPFLTQVPKVLKPYDNWVCWQYHQSGESLIRIPVTPQAKLESAYKLCQSEGYGLGFLLTPENPIAAICIAGYKDEHNHLLPDTEDILKISKTYTEVDDRVGELYVVGFADGEWNVGKDRIRIVSDEFVVPITVDTIGAFSNVSDCQQAFATVARRYCSLSWLEKFETMRESCDEFTALARVLTECLDTQGWLDNAENTDLYEFLGLCWHSPEMRQKVNLRMQSEKRSFRVVDDLDKIARSRMPKQERKTRRATAEDVAISPSDLASMLHYDAKGIKVNEEFYNISMILQFHEEWKGRFKFDAFQNNVILDGKHPLSDSMEYRVTEWFGKHYQFGGNSSKTFLKGIHAAATMHTYDPLQEYIRNLPEWDGTHRLETWMIDMCGSPRNQLSKWTAYMTIMQMVARAMHPGCMARNVPVWEGDENKGKTRMIKLLGDPWSITFDMSMDSKEAHMAIQGVWVAELAELDTLRKTTETRLKSFVSQTQDTFVPKYSNNRTSLPRRTVFFGTTNDEDYLTSVTGNTRWFPISTGNFDHKRLEREREQLFAEAMSVFQENPDVAWWEEPCNIQAMLKAARDQRRSFNPYEESLSEWLDGKVEPDRICCSETSWQDIAKGFLKLETPKEWKDKLLQMQITSALKALGWKKSRAENTTLWKRPGSSVAEQVAERLAGSETPERSEYDDSDLEDDPNSGTSGLPF